MSTYRSRLEAGRHPRSDPRRGQQLRDELRRLADALTPRWQATGEHDDFGSALLRIGARLAEQSTMRLDDTAKRDALAFFDFLGLSPDPPRAASGVLILALEPKQVMPVFAPVRTQVAVTADDDQQALFETRLGLRVIPGGIAELVAVDTTTDHIERSPAQVTSYLAPSALPENYRFVTFSGAGSTTIQLSPAAGLKEGDILRIGDSAHRVATEIEESGLVTLLDALERPATAGTTVAQRISAFETFTLRNIQQHRFYVGHAELLNLEQRATISLEASPASLAAQIRGLDIAYSMYGTKRGEDQPGWQPLEVLGAGGSAIRLAKTWVGSTDEFEVNGQKSRWIRAELRERIIDGLGPTSRASRILLTVASVTEDAEGEGGVSGEGADRHQAEGSPTVAHAAHNGNPLATTGRFYPFGPEPIRFDTFALAAPEALSKKGAQVRLDVTLADSSMESFSVTTAHSVEPWSGYGIGLNGDLQMLFHRNDRFRWLAGSVETKEGQRVVLAPSPLTAIRVGPGGSTDVLVVRDRESNVWAASLRMDGDPPTMTVVEPWHRIDRHDRLRDSDAESLGMPLVMPAPIGAEFMAAVLVDVYEGDLYALRLDRGGRAIGGWTELATGPTGAKPAVSSVKQLTAVQGATWPLRPDRLELIARDDEDALWIGRMSLDPGTSRAVLSWYRPVVGKPPNAGDLPTMSSDVTPTATRFRTEGGDERWWVAYGAPEAPEAPEATEAPSTFVGVELKDGAGGEVSAMSVHRSDRGSLIRGSELHTNPTLCGTAGVPTVVGMGAKPDELLIWQADNPLTVAVLTGPASALRPQLLRIDRSVDLARWEVLVPGYGERLFRILQPNTTAIEYTLHNALRFYPDDITKDWAPDLVEIATDANDTASGTMVHVGQDTRMWYDRDSGLRIFRIDDPQLVDAPQLEVGMRLRFMRLRNKKAVYTATFETPTERDKVTFSTGRVKLVADKSRLVIGQASYLVKAVDKGSGGKTNATLDRPVPTGIEPSFQVVDRENETKVSSDELGILVSLNSSTPPPFIAFGAPAAPAMQKVLRSKKTKEELWALLGKPWTTPPAKDSKAVVPTARPVVRENVRIRDYRNPELTWEYFDGGGWQRLVLDIDGTNHLSASGEIHFTVPRDLMTTEISGKEDYWIRARLIGGDYGRPVYLVTTVTDPKTGDTTQTVVIDTTDLNPPEIIAIEALFGSVGSDPQIVLGENNDDIFDQTQAATLPSASFDLFLGAAAIDPGQAGRALFAGFTGPLTAGPLTLVVDAVDQAGTETLRVDVLTADGWERVPADDRTASMRRTGIISLSLQSDPIPMRLFGKDRTWLRFRPGESAEVSPRLNRRDDRLWAPVIRALLPNAVDISHAQTMDNEILGSSLGAPGTRVQFSSTPVLPESVELRVREDLSLEELESLTEEYRAGTKNSRNPAVRVVETDLERAPGTWVLWRRVDSLIGQPRDARVFVLEPATGRVTFGDDQSGRIPPAGRDGIRAFSYQQGGGRLGNVKAWSETRMTTSLAGVEAAVLPLGVAGGADTPPSQTVFATAPHQLRHAGRALTPTDVEALAVASSGEILRARCRRPQRAPDPVRVAVVVRDETTGRPEPTHTQRESVAAFIRAAGWGGLSENAVEVTGPSYVPLSIKVSLVASPQQWAAVEHEATERVVRFFDSAHGGPFGTGWPFGRRPDQSDLLRALNDVPGIDRVAAVDITTVDGFPLAELPFDGMVCADATDVTVTVGGEGERT